MDPGRGDLAGGGASTLLDEGGVPRASLSQLSGENCGAVPEGVSVDAVIGH